MDNDFSNKVVLVTGAAAGIGEATALLLARLGARLALVDRDEQNLTTVAEKCRKEQGLDVLPIYADLSTDEGCEKTAKVTLNHFERLDILVNNAGIGAIDLIEKADMAVFDKLYNNNLRSVYNLTRLLVPALIKSKGNIVNISSITGTVVLLGALSYAMFKAALDHFTRLTALELAPKGVRVNTVSAGTTTSSFHQRMTGATDEECRKFFKECEKSIPMGKACSSEDIAKIIVHLTSEHSRLVTGTNVYVDGGLQFCNLNNTLKEVGN